MNFDILFSIIKKQMEKEKIKTNCVWGHTHTYIRSGHMFPGRYVKRHLPPRGFSLLVRQSNACTAL